MSLGARAWGLGWGWGVVPEAVPGSKGFIPGAQEMLEALGREAPRSTYAFPEAPKSAVLRGCRKVCWGLLLAASSGDRSWPCFVQWP